MKKGIVTMIIMLTVFISCKKASTEAEEMTPVPSNKGDLMKSEGSSDFADHQCYVSKVNKNMVSLSFRTNIHKNFIGELRYDLEGKDKNEGMVVGSIEGDTLIASYTFKSEGVESIREVAFLKKDGAYIEGYGDVEMVKGIARFKDKKKLKFDSSRPLTKVDCEAK